MGLLIVGADNVRTIEESVIRQLPGFTPGGTEHWSGRKAGDNRKVIPRNTRLVVVVCERISHELLLHVRKQAGKMGLPTVYCRHSVVDIQEKLAAIAPRFAPPADARPGGRESHSRLH